MRHLNKIFFLSTTLVALTGCNSMLEASQNARAGLDGLYNSVTGGSSSTASESVKVTPTTICKDYRANSAKAEYDYVNKTITFKGKVDAIHTWGASVTSGTADIIFMTATTDNTVLHRLQKGKSYTFTGKINQLQLAVDLHKKCVIGLVAKSVK
ncbi:hypothetical protein [Histophilus somni]|uniref:hypothetical protein n=1 Tax=Histophilus somni TaxID=731 RepID=UPI00201F0418|nr:hypothetical protein [Histophilus somni]